MEKARSFTELEWAILQTVAYADIFDYPLRRAEIWHYLIGVSATLREVSDVLQGRRLSPDFLVQRDGYFCLAGREEIVETRYRRAGAAASMWSMARRYGRLIGRLPFVRMVAVTGSLAVDNTEPGSDIDLLIVTVPGRLWMCRLFVVGLVRWVERREGVTLCPNYFLSEKALVIDERDLFAARELAQMVPVAGLETYSIMRRLNDWTHEYLPNASGPPPMHREQLSSVNGYSKQAAETILRMPPGAWLDHWEMKRKVRKLTQRDDKLAEADFSRDWCKGHFDGHKQRITSAFESRLHTLKRNAHQLSVKM